MSRKTKIISLYWILVTIGYLIIFFATTRLELALGVIVEGAGWLIAVKNIDWERFNRDWF